MPELPEVESAARELARAARGRTIERLAILHPALRRRLSDAEAGSVAGSVVVEVERRGKHQLVRLADGRTLHVHFRMSGDWAVGRADDATLPHARAVLDLTDGVRVTLVDPRALATIELLAPGGEPLPGLGPDALDPRFDAAALRGALARKRSAIKPALLDQRVVAGIGNIYAAEALWRAGIDPRAVAARLSAARAARLLGAIRETLDRARRTPSRYYGAGGEPRFQVYDREGEPCRRCAAAIRRIVQGGRSTYYCPRCQR
ncbi:MAG TPA: bifunctional DNA-formamidopyrimidine glycosylase/DNA-(apurinic or apyrimidinic site) lyase [Gemmatimonadaceae bacterium]|nr:bifunctional DNA-formamidopyrimidine glycosylase/DNA-(apurinic or apyrimidinic site) lyase [Gemmatimonadaceae bacterium]